MEEARNGQGRGGEVPPRHNAVEEARNGQGRGGEVPPRHNAVPLPMT